MTIMRTKEQKRHYWIGFFAALALVAFTLLFSFAVFAAYNRIFRPRPYVAPVSAPVQVLVAPNPKPTSNPPAHVPATIAPVSSGTPADRAACFQVTIFNNIQINQGAQDWRKCVEDQKAILISRISSPQATPAMSEELRKLEAQGY